jgi:CheY-like chemotaxis protein
MDNMSSRLRILLIDDDPGVREVLAVMLASLGHSVVQAPGGREGLGLLEAGIPVDLVLTDLRMPQMTGWDVVRDVRARWPHVRIGLITGTPEALWERREPVDLVIAKPVTVDGLNEAISRACR